MKILKIMIKFFRIFTIKLTGKHYIKAKSGKTVFDHSCLRKI